MGDRYISRDIPKTSCMITVKQYKPFSIFVCKPIGLQLLKAGFEMQLAGSSHECCLDFFLTCLPYLLAARLGTPANYDPSGVAIVQCGAAQPGGARNADRAWVPRTKVTRAPTRRTNVPLRRGRLA
jgi:hypothetical protein